MIPGPPNSAACSDDAAGLTLYVEGVHDPATGPAPHEQVTITLTATIDGETFEDRAAIELVPFSILDTIYYGPVVNTDDLATTTFRNRENPLSSTCPEDGGKSGSHNCRCIMEAAA